MSVWRRVTSDFDFYLDAPSATWDRAMDALLAFLDIEVVESPYETEWWAVRITAAAAAGPTRLLSALSTEDLRRTAAFVLSYCTDPGPLDDVGVDDEPTRLALHIATGVHRGWSPAGDDLAAFGRAFGALLVSRPVTPEILTALSLCAGAPGRTLMDLPWAEPEWDTPISAVDTLLQRAPGAHFEWLRTVPAEMRPALADSAARTEDVSLVELYGIALLAHDNVEIRRAAVGRLSRRWRTDAYQDAVAALLTDPDVGDAATDKLAELADHRCLPQLIARVNRLESLRYAHSLGTELLPHVLRKLAEPLPSEAATDMLLTAAQWGDPPLLMRPEAAEWVARLGKDAEAHCCLMNICHRVSLTRRVSQEMRAELRSLVTELPIRVRQHAQYALLEAGDAEWLTPVLIAEITNHPVRTGTDGPHKGGHGWRSDATACVWLGKLGATEAVPVLLALMAETGEPGEARPEAAEAYWRITGDATTTLSIVDELASALGDLGVRARDVVARIRS